jgi:hypothetical protein
MEKQDEVNQWKGKYEKREEIIKSLILERNQLLRDIENLTAISKCSKCGWNWNIHKCPKVDFNADKAPKSKRK